MAIDFRQSHSVRISGNLFMGPRARPLAFGFLCRLMTRPCISARPSGISERINYGFRTLLTFCHLAPIVQSDQN